MNTDELVLFGQGLDLDTPTGEEEFWQERVDEVLEKAFREHDADYALNACIELIKIAKLSGKALARLLYMLRENWTTFDVDEPFREYIIPKLGLDPQTVDRYVRVEELIRTLPSGMEEIAQRPISHLIPIANAVAQGVEFEPEDWHRLELAPTVVDIRAEIRDITGAEPRKAGINLYIDRRGSIWANKAGELKFIGSLELADEDEVVKKSISRILDRSGIMRQ